MRQFYRCLSIVLAVSFCATLLWTPPAAAEDAAAVAVQAAAASDSGIQVAQANPFSDVPQNSWAYDAVRQLAAEGLITGYPDNTFKGNRPMTRYEMAVLVNRAVNAIQSKIAAAVRSSSPTSTRSDGSSINSVRSSVKCRPKCGRCSNSKPR